MTSKTEHAAMLAAVLLSEWYRPRAAMTPRQLERKYGGSVIEPGAHVVARDALELIKIGNGVARWAVKACNGHGRVIGRHSNGELHWQWTQADDDLHNAADARALAKATEIAQRYGATVTIGGDPRGFTMRLMLASGRKNGMGDGWGVA